MIAGNIFEIETRKFEGRTIKSKNLFEQAKKVIPFGVHSNYRLTDPYPVYGVKAKGSRIWDVDGNEYVDYGMGFGALATGHSHPVLVEEVSKRLQCGTILGLEFEDSVRLAEVIAERFRADMVRFSSTGMEATMHAIRIARAYTNRNKVVKFEGCYHGSHDHVLVSVKPKQDKAGDPLRPTPVPASLGTPSDTLKNTVVAPFNDLESTRSIIEESVEDLAGIILEPIPMNMGFIMPEKGFLEGLREICDEHNSVLIFDEVKTCGKYYGGATERFGVNPDLKVLGKAIGGGFPLSAVAGRKEVMEKIVPGVVAHAGTFNSNPVAITAGLTTLTRILTRNAFIELAKVNQQLSKAYTDIIKDDHLTAIVASDGISGALSFSDKPIRNWRDFQRSNIGKWYLYYLMMLNRSIIPAGTGPDEQWTISVQHTREEVDEHIETFKQVAPLLKDFEMAMPIVEAI